jgi:hypothetical protein
MRNAGLLLCAVAARCVLRGAAQVAVGAAASAAAAAAPTAAPTVAAPTAPPTALPTSAPTAPPPTDLGALLVTADEALLGFFRDPFADDKHDMAAVAPPLMVVSGGRVDAQWSALLRPGGVRLGEHVSRMAFDLWVGSPAAALPFTAGDIKVEAFSSSPELRLEVTIREGEPTTRVEVVFRCAASGSSVVTVALSRMDGRGGRLVFGAAKECRVMEGASELLISNHAGATAFVHGRVDPSFDVRSSEGAGFVAGKEDQSDAFYVHTLSREFRVVGTPYVEAYEAPRDFLDMFARRSSELAEVVAAFNAAMADSDEAEDAKVEETEQEEDEEAEGEQGDEDEDEDADAAGGSKAGGSAGDSAAGDSAAGDSSAPSEEEEPDGSAYDDGIDRSNLTEAAGEQLAAAARAPTRPVALATLFSAGVLKPSTKVCRPKVGGEVAKRGKKRQGTLIAHRKDLGEKKLLGFAQAGQLGMHGGKRLEVTYNCVDDGLAVIVLRLSLVPLQQQEGDGKKPEIQNVVLSWLKVCSAEQMGEGAIDLMGVDVHLGTHAKDDPAFFPVLNGITTEAFTWDGAALQAGPEEFATSFYVSLNRAVLAFRDDLADKTHKAEQFVRVRGVRITLRDNVNFPVLDPKLSGHGAEGGVITDEPLPISVHYNCLRTGQVRIGVDLLVDIVVRNASVAADEADGAFVPLQLGESADGLIDAPLRRVSFYWIKQCKLSTLVQFQISTADPNMFELAPAAAHNKSKSTPFLPTSAVHKGEPLALFKTSSGDADTAVARLFALAADQPTLALKLMKDHNPRYVRLDKGNEDIDSLGLSFGLPVLSVSNTGVVVSLRSVAQMDMMAIEGKEEYAWDHDAADAKKKQRKAGIYDDSLSIIEVTRANPAFLVIDHQCVTPGAKAVVTLQLPVFAQGGRAVTLSWAKHCGWFDVQVSAKQAGGAVAAIFTVTIILTSAVFCFFMRKQVLRIKLLERINRDKNGFEKMDIATSI